MTEERSAPGQVRGPGFNAREVPVGATIRLVDGATAEVIDNPRDGMWLLCRYISDEQGRSGTTEPVFVQDVLGLLSQG